MRTLFRNMGSVVLAYSGGVDSTFLLKVASEVLGDRLLAVTALSPTYPGGEHERACAIARSLGVRHVTIRTDELQNPEFCANPPDRCYYCKSELMRELRAIADREGIGAVAEASNLDDCEDFRPGRRAVQEAAVRSPLLEVGLTKDEIRMLSKEMDLPTWELPSMACLASRFPYGETITTEKLRRVEQAEAFLRELGLRQVRVRSHGEVARIEVEAGRVRDLADPGLRLRVVNRLKSLGFAYVTIDLEGYRTGSMNEVLTPEQRARAKGS